MSRWHKMAEEARKTIPSLKPKVLSRKEKKILQAEREKKLIHQIKEIFLERLKPLIPKILKDVEVAAKQGRFTMQYTSRPSHAFTLTTYPTYECVGVDIWYVPIRARRRIMEKRFTSDWPDNHEAIRDHYCSKGYCEKLLNDLLRSEGIRAQMSVSHDPNDEDGCPGWWTYCIKFSW
ncbi:hypothetical protein COT97_05790 [Candidatus Falkowbacteria bacterium CG10_big_fil_rev_8_21_14_0_10_39_11]|uniref:Uncharacterized protein n=1 Tax=Candidatus Falkowbacteria bacterium CG10_big_fil_rev_8_21_14_0_10_39_11 TaxID=1974565 RepID=A0A2H0V5H7_9BACT|nr:MAG: hypothetical protein COT97_05790 [Candidatus Falkowbacteria bacterium CG10_big_fil_rev_8_21_14_0_10_39_11]